MSIVSPSTSQTIDRNTDLITKGSSLDPWVFTFNVNQKICSLRTVLV